MDTNKTQGPPQAANRLIERRQGDETLATYRQTIEMYPMSDDSDKDLLALAKQDKWDEVMFVYHKAIELNYLSSDLEYDIVEMLHKKGHLDEAIIYCSLALSLSLNSNRYQFIKKLIQIATEYNSLAPHLQVFFQEFDLVHNASNYQDLRKDTSTLIEQSITNKSFYNKLGELFYQVGHKLHHQGLYKEAEIILKSAVTLNNKLFWAHHILASTLKVRHQYEQAINHFKLAIKSNPSHFGHHWRLAQTYREKGDTSSAVAAYTKSLELSQNAHIQEELDDLVIQKAVESIDTCSTIDELENWEIDKVIDIYLDRPRILSKLSVIYENRQKHLEADKLKQAVSVHFDLSKSSKVLLIVFASRNEDYAQIKFQFRKLLLGLQINKIFLRDVNDSWYNKGIVNFANNIKDLTTYLKQQISKIEPQKIVTLGSSSGGYAALLFGFLLEVDNVIAFSPQTKIPRPKPFPDEELLKDCDNKYFDLLDFHWESVKTKFDVHYSENYLWDRDAALRMKTYSNFNLYSYEAGKIHNVAAWLRNSGKLKPIILDALQEN